MANVVVDSSVVIKWLVVEPFSVESRRILNDYQSGLTDLIAPDLLIAEVGNIVWKKQQFQGRSDAEGKVVLNAFLNLNFTLTSATTLLQDAHQLAVLHKRTVYDSLYLALSVRENCPFVTADQKLFNAVGAAFPNLTWVANWP